MKREIKFRGKSIIGDKWVYGDLLHIGGGYIINHGYQKDYDISHDNKFAIQFYHEEVSVVFPDTVGQFTGLFDNDKKEIYEGDIIRWRRDGKLYLVKFYAGMSYASVEELNKGVYGGIPLHVLTVNEEDEYKCEVCGNIYDNPDLLKGCSHE